LCIKIKVTIGKSWGSYIDHGKAFLEVEDIIPETQIGNYRNGYDLKFILEKLGHMVEFEDCSEEGFTYNDLV